MTRYMEKEHLFFQADKNMKEILWNINDMEKEL